MNQVILPGTRSGNWAAVPSKSQLHRLLICAALSNAPVTITSGAAGADIDATIRCLRALGAEITVGPQQISVRGIGYAAEAPTTENSTVSNAVQKRPEVRLDVGESGSTLRFLLPVVGALGIPARIQMHGRLPQRPMEPLAGLLTAHGMTLQPDGNALHVSGQLCPGTLPIAGNVSSQYLSGLCFALPLLDGDSEIKLTTELQSAPYLEMTQQAIARASIRIDPMDGGWRISGRQQYRAPSGAAEGDWSNAAFPMCIGALGGSGVTVVGVRPDSAQGDRAICAILRRFGANVVESDHSVTVTPAALHGITIDAAAVPDLVPALAAVAACADGETHIVHAERLRLKESDRLHTVCAALTALGASVTERPDGLTVRGTPRLRGGTVDGAGDHRIAMLAAVAAVRCNNSVTVCGAEAVAKSEPDFWDKFAQLETRNPTH